MGKAENDTLYYIIELPFESEYLNIDWQADSPALLINCGPENPTIVKSDFVFNSSQYDTVLSLKKQTIVNQCTSRGMTLDNKLKFLQLSLAIYSKKVDTLYTSVYVFKLFMPQTYTSIYQTEEGKKMKE